MLTKNLLAASVLALVPLVPARAQSPAPNPPTIVVAPSAQQVVYSPVGYAWPGGSLLGCSSPNGTRQIVWGPGPIGLGLAAIGEKLTHLNRQHVWTITHTRSVPARTRLVRRVYYEVVPVPAVGCGGVTPAPQSYQFAPAIPCMNPKPVAVAEAAPPVPAVPDLEPGSPAGK